MNGTPYLYAPAAYITQRAGTRHWVLAPRLTARMKEKGYTKAIPRKLYSQWQDEYASAVKRFMEQS